MSLPELTFPEAIDSTMLSAFDSCPQKFFVEFVLRKTPIGRSLHLHAGGCMASAFERIQIDFYKHGYSQEEAIERAFIPFVKDWGDFETPEKEYKDFTNCWAAVEAYFKEYPLATDYFQPYIKADGSPAVEFKFAIPMEVNHPVTGNPLLFSGRADKLAVPRSDPHTAYVVDEKTTKSMGSSWQYQWGMRGQFYGYTFAGRRMGFPVVGALVRGIAIQQTQFQFQEKPLFFTDDQLEIWWIEAHKKVYRMVAMFNAAQEALAKHPDPDQAKFAMHGSFDKSFGEACQAYGGCMYQDLCTHPKPWLLWQGFETRIWNPLAKDPAAESEDRSRALETISLRDAIWGT